jgi:hypothetical protein
MSRAAPHVLALLTLSVLAHSTANAQRTTTLERVLLVPADLYQYADSLNCDQVTDFYENRVGVREPPFVYLDSPAAWWETASALWCRPRGGPPRRHTLLFRFGSLAGPMGRCPIRIENQEHIGGLSVRRGFDLTLDHFRYVDEPNKTGPKVPLTGPAIRSEYDGTGTLYYCYEGRWLEFFLH